LTDHHVTWWTVELTTVRCWQGRTGEGWSEQNGCTLRAHTPQLQTGCWPVSCVRIVYVCVCTFTAVRANHRPHCARRVVSVCVHLCVQHICVLRLRAHTRACIGACVCVHVVLQHVVFAHTLLACVLFVVDVRWVGVLSSDGARACFTRAHVPHVRKVICTHCSAQSHVCVCDRHTLIVFGPRLY
jgi:hypothetical protein